MKCMTVEHDIITLPSCMGYHRKFKSELEHFYVKLYSDYAACMSILVHISPNLARDPVLIDTAAVTS